MEAIRDGSASQDATAPSTNVHPPADDTRRNETTWTKFKLLEDERREAESTSSPKTTGH